MNTTKKFCVPLTVYYDASCPQPLSRLGLHRLVGALLRGAARGTRERSF